VLITEVLTQRAALLPLALALGVFFNGSAYAEGADIPMMDVITLKDGSIIHGQVLDMENGELRVKTAFGVGDVLKVKWANVSKLSIEGPQPVHLKDGTVLVGRVQAGEEGTLLLSAEPATQPIVVPFDTVVSINPLVQPPVTFQGAFTGGLSANSGNTELTNFSLLFDLVARHELWRVTLFGRYIYGENAGNVIARNSRATAKVDYFVTKRFYVYGSSYFEQDTFQDLRLRTALTAGPGYQIINQGDFASPYAKDMTLSFEAGAGYFHEDFKQQPDTTTSRARFSVRWNWPLFKERVLIYHFDEFFPSFQDTNDYYLTTDQGIRLTIFEGFVANFQLTYRYNNSPPAGIKNSDTLYVFTLGYGFDTTAKR
jgi:putative salt-induced outer membrane protein YdiY